MAEYRFALKRVESLSGFENTRMDCSVQSTVNIPSGESKHEIHKQATCSGANVETFGIFSNTQGGKGERQHRQSNSCDHTPRGS